MAKAIVCLLFASVCARLEHLFIPYSVFGYIPTLIVQCTDPPLSFIYDIGLAFSCLACLLRHPVLMDTEIES